MTLDARPPASMENHASSSDTESFSASSSSTDSSSSPKPEQSLDFPEIERNFYKQEKIHERFDSMEKKNIGKYGLIQQKDIAETLELDDCFKTKK